jgi:hypothetical protein
VSDVTDRSSPRARTARCGCGALSVTARGEPAAVYACSCLVCQKKSGSAFTYSAVFADATVMVRGERRTWRHHGESGRWIESEFCPTCGITVCFRSEGWPGLVGIPVGCFADPEFGPPSVLFWAARRHRWLAFPHDIAAIDTQPG